MNSLFACIGLPLENDGDCRQVVQYVLDQGSAFETPEGVVAVHTLSCGAQLWLRFDKALNLQCVTPGVRGKGEMPVSIAGSEQDERFSQPDMLHVWARPASAKQDLSAEFPFVCDMPGKPLFSDALSTTHWLQITALAEALTVYPQLDAFKESEFGGSFASRSFVPIGLFNQAETDAGLSDAESRAMFCGEVVEAKRQMNPLTGEPYYWALVETLGGSVDVVCSLLQAPAGVQPGNILMGEFRLVAQPLAD